MKKNIKFVFLNALLLIVSFACSENVTVQHETTDNTVESACDVVEEVIQVEYLDRATGSIDPSLSHGYIDALTLGFGGECQQAFTITELTFQILAKENGDEPPFHEAFYFKDPIFKSLNTEDVVGLYAGPGEFYSTEHGETEHGETEHNGRMIFVDMETDIQVDEGEKKVGIFSVRVKDYNKQLAGRKFSAWLIGIETDRPEVNIAFLMNEQAEKCFSVE